MLYEEKAKKKKDATCTSDSGQTNAELCDRWPFYMFFASVYLCVYFMNVRVSACPPGSTTIGAGESFYECLLGGYHRRVFEFSIFGTLELINFVSC